MSHASTEHAVLTTRHSRHFVFLFIALFSQLRVIHTPYCSLEWFSAHAKLCLYILSYHVMFVFLLNFWLQDSCFEELKFPMVHEFASLLKKIELSLFHVHMIVFFRMRILII